MTLFIIALVVCIGLIARILIGRSPHPSAEEQWEIDRREQLAKIALLESRRDQMKHQTEGIIRRYRQTDENRINAMLRQARQEQEIQLLKLKVRVLEMELGDDRVPFSPDDYPHDQKSG